MTLRNVPKGYTLEQQRQEINLVAADLNTAIDGVQTFNGAKTFANDVIFQSNVSWGDLDKAIFGDDEDLKIYYDPSTGGAHIEAPIDLKLQTGRLIVNDAANSAVQLVANQNGSVELYYNALKKFETSNTGATVTGTLIADEFSGQVTGDVTGNADTATALETARNIAGQSFDGTADITIAATDLSDTDQSLSTTDSVTFASVNASVTGNSSTATALETARNIAGQSFDGTADITIAATDLSDTDQALATTSDVSFNSIGVGTTSILSSGNVSMGDDVKILLGTDNDVEVYFDSANSEAVFKATDINFSNATQSIADFKSNGTILWYNGAISLRLKSTAVSLTNTVEVIRTNGVSSTTVGHFKNYDPSGTPLGVGGLTQSDTRLRIESYPDSGGNPYIRFESGGTNHIVGQVYAGTTNNKLVLGPGSDPTLVTGITIDGIGNVSTNNLSFSSQTSGSGSSSEVLDHYEEGTWTPVIKSGSNIITCSGGNQVFTYTRIGDTVHVYFSIDGGTTSGTTGDFWTIEGLPFSALSTTGYSSIGSIIFWDGVGLQGDSWPASPHISAGSTTLNIYSKANAAASYANVNVNAVGSSTSIFFTITYKTDS
jgi:hypothetical protein